MFCIYSYIQERGKCLLAEESERTYAVLSWDNMGELGINDEGYCSENEDCPHFESFYEEENHDGG